MCEKLSTVCAVDVNQINQRGAQLSAELLARVWAGTWQGREVKGSQGSKRAVNVG